MFILWLWRVGIIWGKALLMILNVSPGRFQTMVLDGTGPPISPIEAWVNHSQPWFGRFYTYTPIYRKHNRYSHPQVEYAMFKHIITFFRDYFWQVHILSYVIYFRMIIYVSSWLVVWNMFYFSTIYGMSSETHWLSLHHFSRCEICTTNQSSIVCSLYPLVNIQKTMENHHFCNGKIHYKWQFSIAILT